MPAQDEIHSSEESLEALLRLAPKFLRHVVLREGLKFGQGEVWQLLERAEAQVTGAGGVVHQNAGYLLYIRDETLSSYIGMIISHYKDPY